MKNKNCASNLLFLDHQIQLQNKNQRATYIHLLPAHKIPKPFCQARENHQY
jgi:hypothetical protein